MKNSNANPSDSTIIEALTPGTHEIMVDGLHLTYHVMGSGPVCLVHPGGPGFHWNYLRMPLLENFMTTIYLEPIGTGQSDLLPNGEYSQSNYAYFSRKVLEHVGALNAYFLGHSHGGFVGLQYALDYPNELAGLIVYDGAPCSGKDLFMEATKQMDLFAQRWPEEKEAQEAKQAWVDMTSGAIAVNDRESFLGIIQKLLPAYLGNYWAMPLGFDEWKASMDATIDANRKPAMWDVRDVMNTIQTRALVLVGEHDFICGTRWADEMSAAIPESQLVVIEQCGHMGHVEKPELFSNAVRDFVINKLPHEHSHLES
ncbi:alpha/beta fold hydrolase [Paenibacillus sp. CF384]|uniref:alpha/beta fold hydrolase n=1 Tax=Paenibacillus sp. CF384 TaxID=1884382 RepID=UPI00089BC503|nr:alpha/beta hydrolase [Paenibacillus sp. CF384]SDW61161.1 proline iminopeptidase [Paenibacillus sp. CF384]